MKLHLLKVHLQKFPSTPITQNAKFWIVTLLSQMSDTVPKFLSYVRDGHTSGIFKSHNKEEETKKTAE